MDDKTLFETLGAARLDDENTFETLGEATREHRRESGRAAAAAWGDFDVIASPRAALVLERLGDVAILPLAEMLSPVVEGKEQWRIRTLIAAELRLRAQVIERLAASLSDRRPIPVPPVDMEEAEIPRRICDEAYILLRRIMSLEESTEQLLNNERAFLQLDEARKDEQILMAAQSRIWTDFSGSEGG